MYQEVVIYYINKNIFLLMLLNDYMNPSMGYVHDEPSYEPSFFDMA